MLTRVEIKNFRSCHDVVLDNLEPVTVLVGRNAAGKTNILRAIQSTASFAAPGPPLHELRTLGDVSLQATTGQAKYSYSLETSSGLAESLGVEDAHGAKHVLFSRKNGDVELPHAGTLFKTGASAPCIPAIMSLLPAEHPEIALIRPFLSFLEKVRYYPLEVQDRPLDEGDVGSVPIVPGLYEEWLARYRGAGDPSDQVLMRLLHAWLTDSAVFEEICSLLGPNGLGLIDKIEVAKIEAPSTSGQIEGNDSLYWMLFQPTFQPSIHPGPVNSFSFRNLSAGTQRVVRLIVSLLFDKSSVMLVEHPEDGIHRGLLRKLIDVLQAYSDQSQLIVSSHSSVVFNATDPGAVRLVTMEKGETKARALTPAERAAADKFLEEEGSLSDFLDSVEED